MSELPDADDATFTLATGEELVMPGVGDDPAAFVNDDVDVGMVPADDRSIDGSLPQLSPAPLGGRPPRPTFFDKRTAGRLRARKVRRLVRHVEPWSVLKISLIFYFCLWIILLIAGVMLWNLAVSSGTVDNIETFVTELFALESFTFNADQIFRASSIGGLVLVVAGAGFTVLMAVLFNLISDVTGGMRFTVVEEEKHIETLTNMHHAGVRFTTGLDMGMTYGTHDRSAANAWSFVEKLGWSNWKAINAATSGTAEALGLNKEIGSLQTGMNADLAAFGGDPSKNIRDMDRASTVVQAGRLLKLNDTVLV